MNVLTIQKQKTTPPRAPQIRNRTGLRNNGSFYRVGPLSHILPHGKLGNSYTLNEFLKTS